MKMCSRSSVAIVAILLGFALIATISRPVAANEEPAFFLKIAKNIPRVGRSGRFEDYFLKAAKNIPRIGRRDGHALGSEKTFVENGNEAFNGPTKRVMNIPSIGMDDPTWSHFPLAIEGPPELWRTLAAYTNERTGFGPDDIDNEIWRRDKRSDQSTMSTSV